MIYEGQPPQYVASQLGNYARVWEDFDPSQRIDAEAHIDRVRRVQRRRAPQSS